MFRRLLGLSIQTSAILSTATIACAAAVAVSSVPAARADEVQVTVIQAPAEMNRDEAKCRGLLEATFAQQGLDPADPKIQQSITALCRSETRKVLLVSEKAPDPIVTFDLTGSYTDGNVKSGSLSFETTVEKEWDKDTLEASLQGALVLEDGTVFHSFSLSTNNEYFLSDHWSLFGLVGMGRDTGKAIGFTTGEFVGAMFHVFGREAKHQLKVSAAVGHRYELPIEGGEYSATNLDGFSSNKAMMSYRIKYEDKLLNDSLELVAALWFQHVLYGPATETTDEQIFDFTDYRVYADLKIRFVLTEFGKAKELGGRRGKLSLETGVSYDYYARPLSSSPWDLVIEGGLAVSY